jgi:alpha-L-arabinofuranosidase
VGKRIKPVMLVVTCSICLIIIIGVIGYKYNLSKDKEGTMNTLVSDKDNKPNDLDDVSQVENQEANQEPNQIEYQEVTQKEKLDTNQYILNVNTDIKGVEISNMMYGLFFEDINFAADGGLYAEMIKNRSFEYTDELANNGPLHGYNQYGDCSLEVESKESLNANNPNYLHIENQTGEMSGFINSGFLEGMSFTEGEIYRFTVYLKSSDYHDDIVVKLLGKKDNEISSGAITGVTNEWTKYTVELKANASAFHGKLLFAMKTNGTLNVDMVSLFPTHTYKNRENGLRADLVQMLADLNPSFIRFPGGCIVEGDPLSTAYRWKDTIGDVAIRKQNTNLWIGTKEHPYYQSYGLGFYEYFLLCEDLHAEPVPVVNAGLSCQARSNGKTGVLCSDDELETYIQDALDLIEFCNGDTSTKWGAIRAEMGHPEPFNLKYLAVGNENWDTVYFNRYSKFVEPIRSRYPDIKLITTSGPVSEGNLNNIAWNTISAHKNDTYKFADLIDEHYYNSADWFLSNANRYDSYKRNYVDVFLGEYAAKANTLYAAVAEAAYMTGLERNADVVKMASYAPLFGNLLSRQWSPDMIYFNNTNAFGSINYYVQKMFSNNLGTYTLQSELDIIKGETLSLISGKVGLGTWNTSAVFDDIKVVDNISGETLYESDFADSSEWKQSSQGDWNVQDDNGNSVYAQSNTTYPTNGSIMGSATYIGDNNWSNYTYTLKAKKIAGAEGFLIPFAVQDSENFYHWNLGGWGNTGTCIEQAQDGSKTIVSDTIKLPIKTNQWYEIKIVVNPDKIECFLDNKLIHTVEKKLIYPVYQTVSKDDETKDIIIKIVNAGDEANVTINLSQAANLSNKGTLQLLTGNRRAIENTVLKPENVVPIESNIEVSNSFNYNAPSYSVSIIRIPTK